MSAWITVEYDRRDPFDHALAYVLADAENALRQDYGLPIDNTEED